MKPFTAARNAYLGLGSNLGNSEATFTQAIRLIGAEVGPVLQVSGFYRSTPLVSDAVPFIPQPNFLNAVLISKTALSALELLDTVRKIENSLGLNREIKSFWGPREIDIDILALGEEILQTADLKVPHAELGNRDFVLIPLKEIAQDFIHPANGMTIDTMIKDYRAKGRPQFLIASQM